MRDLTDKAAKAIRILTLIVKQLKRHRTVTLHRDWIAIRCCCGDYDHEVVLDRDPSAPWSTALLDLLQAMEEVENLLAHSSEQEVLQAEEKAVESSITTSDALASSEKLRRSVTLFQTGVMLSNHFVDPEA